MVIIAKTIIHHGLHDFKWPYSQQQTVRYENTLSQTEFQMNGWGEIKGTASSFTPRFQLLKRASKSLSSEEMVGLLWASAWRRNRQWGTKTRQTMSRDGERSGISSWDSCGLSETNSKICYRVKNFNLQTLNSWWLHHNTKFFSQ